jgi:hypothetical protein
MGTPCLRRLAKSAPFANELGRPEYTTKVGTKLVVVLGHFILFAELPEASKTLLKGQENTTSL